MIFPVSRIVAGALAFLLAFLEPASALPLASRRDRPFPFAAFRSQALTAYLLQMLHPEEEPGLRPRLNDVIQGPDFAWAGAAHTAGPVPGAVDSAMQSRATTVRAAAVRSDARADDAEALRTRLLEEVTYLQTLVEEGWIEDGKKDPALHGWAYWRRAHEDETNGRAEWLDAITAEAMRWTSAAKQTLFDTPFHWEELPLSGRLRLLRQTIAGIPSAGLTTSPVPAPLLGDPVAGRLVKAHLHSVGFVRYYMRWRKRLFGERRGLRVGVGAAGVSVSDVWLIAPFRTAYFFDRLPQSMWALEDAIEKWDAPLDQRDAYFGVKRRQGHAETRRFDRAPARFLIEELKAMGVTRDSVKPPVLDDKGRTTLTFQVPGEDEESTIVFVPGLLQYLHADVLKGDVPLNLWLEKAIQDAATTAPDRASLVGEWLEDGAYLLENPAIAWSKDAAAFDQALRSRGYRPVAKEEARAWAQAVLGATEADPDGYGWGLMAWKKAVHPLRRLLALTVPNILVRTGPQATRAPRGASRRSDPHLRLAA